MISPLTIRRYQETDLNEVWILWHTALGNLTPEQVPSIDQYEGDDENLLHIDNYYLKDGDGEFLVGIFESQLVAITALKKSSVYKATIRHMSVHINFHRMGFGRLMMQAIEQRAIDLGCTQLELDTSIAQVPAQKLYLKCGFHEVGHDFVGIGNWEIILYEKHIGK